MEAIAYARITPTALEVPEILVMVFSHVGPSSLLACCQVCRFWWTWAAEVLWTGNIVTMKAVLRLLAPIRLEHWIHADRHSKIETTYDEVSASHWSRVILYSHKVRSLKLDVSLDSSSINTLRRLETTYGSRLLPAITSISVEAITEQNETLSIALGTSLESATFTTTPQNLDQHQMMMFLGSRIGSQITSLSVFRRLLPALDLCLFPRLEKLYYRHGFRGDRWFHIAATCPRLKQLVLYQLGNWDSGHSTDGSGLRATFPELDRLDVLSWRASYFLDIIERSTIPRLQYLNILLHPPWKEGIHPILTLERIRKQTSGLTTLGLNLPLEMSADILRQVLSWKFLVQLRLHTIKCKIASTEVLDEILPLGARLEKLHLTQEARDSELTVWTFISLAKHLVRLVELQIMLAVNGDDTRDALAARWNPFRKLRTLYVSVCATEDEIDRFSSKFITFLVAISPELEELTIKIWNEISGTTQNLEKMYWILRREGKEGRLPERDSGR